MPETPRSLVALESKAPNIVQDTLVFYRDHGGIDIPPEVPHDQVDSFPSISVTGQEWFTLTDTSMMDAADIRLAQQSIKNLQLEIFPEFDTLGEGTEEFYGLGTNVQLRSSSASEQYRIALEDKYNDRRSIPQPLSALERTRRTFRTDTFVDALSSGKLTSLDRALLEALVSQDNTRKVFMLGYNIPKGPISGPSPMGHDYYVAIEKKQEAVWVKLGGLSIDINVLGIGGDHINEKSAMQAIDIWLNQRKDLYGEEYCKQILPHILAVRKRLLEQKRNGRFIQAPYHNQLYGDEISGDATDTRAQGESYTDTIRQEFGIQTSPESDQAAIQILDTIHRIRQNFPATQAEGLFIPRGAELTELMSKKIAEIHFWKANPALCPAPVLRLMERRAKRLFQTDFKDVSEDQLVFLAARSLYVEWKVPMDKVPEVFSEVSERIKKYQDRLIALGITVRGTVSPGWKTFGFAGSRTMDLDNQNTFISRGLAFGYDEAWLNMESMETEDVDKIKHITFHEMLHMVQHSTTLPKEQGKFYDIKKPTTFVEVLTDWLTHREYPVFQSAYAKGRKTFEDFIQAQLQTGTFTEADVQTIEDAAITQNSKMLRDFIQKKTGQSIDRLLHGFTDYDFYHTTNITHLSKN